MYTLLSWLWERAIRLYDWFGPKFYEYRDTVLNIWNTAWNFAQDAYDRAVNWAQRAVLWVRELLQAAQQGLVALMNSAISAVYQWATTKLTEFLAWVQAVKTEILTWANSSIIQARKDAQQWIAQARENLWNIARGWVDEIIAWVHPIVSLEKPLADLLTIFSPRNKERLVDFLGRGYEEVLDFFRDPTGFIYEKIETTFLSFLCYILAKAIGSRKHELPKTFSHKEN